MFFVDRSAVIVKPTAVFLDWLNGTSDSLPDLTLDQLRSNCSTYLVPQSDTPEAIAGYFSAYWLPIFRAELASWEIPESQWPNITPEAFTRFFDLEFHDMVIDLEDSELQVSPLIDNMM